MRTEPRAMPFLLVAVLAVGCGDGDEAAAVAEDQVAAVAADADESRPPADGIIVSGFSGPESVLHDPQADVYLVSNVAGETDAKDGNGFISRVSPDGTITDLRWIDGAMDGVTLNAPKGMALRGETLLVADIDVVRLFNRRSGAPVGEWAVEGSTFLNDVAVGPNGTAYVTDSGVRFTDAGPENTGTAAIHTFRPDGSHGTFEAGDVTGINGVAVSGGTVYGVTSFGNGMIFSVQAGTRTEMPPLPGVNFDGVVVVDGGLLISDWTTEAVYFLMANGAATIVALNVTSPADIGIDRTRDRVLIPSLMTDQVLLAPISD
jgi:hypothetical protein